MYPTFFMAHGIPTLLFENNTYTRFLKNLGKHLPKPKGIVIFSSHWESSVQKITGTQRLETLKDFFGYPDELYQYQYPARGDIVLTLKLQKLLALEGIRCEIDDDRGLDHGAWSILGLMYPAGDVPVVTASVNPRLAPEDSYRIGMALSSLRGSGYLIIASGGTVHNLGKLGWDHLTIEPWAFEFDQWLDDHIQIWDTDTLFHYEGRAPHIREAVPTKEHLIPLFLSMGASDKQKRAKLLHQEYQFGSLSLNCWMFS
jgi:4,5-DOPA dioxygenase extradiol